MADVAKLAGVSGQTVSRVANGHSNVDATTRDRVLDAMKTLGYRPNVAARALRTGRSGSIGVIMFSLSTFGNRKTLDAIAMAAADEGYATTLIPILHPSQGAVSDAFVRLSEQAVDGVVIVIEAHVLDSAEIVLPAGLPVVIVDSDAGERYTVVDTDQYQGAQLATQHLLDLGHPQVWHISGPPSSFSAARRTQSWRATLEAANIVPPPVLIGDWSTTSGYELAQSLVARPEVTAIFAANDQMALGAMMAIHEAGREIPASISVVGFDDTEESGAFWPPLTTIHQDFVAVGRLCIDKLIAEIVGGHDTTGTTLVATRLVARSSTAPLGGTPH
ncbi:LacI family DNA-binding transcriptional regulator [Subtercola vilae]|uniref:LacI family DNA-binding transcriptional regulator n=2 Tax=Microbacteriaceae TaxID=85023 RepID=A0A4T2C423_9MICO|nr:LacI family DNA-binding transcriptional regulator [Subtercola vilae]MEA9986247.1 LacI family DNA-binding transcriptional regulator [Subtercola sp. RTI3]TIH39103.1 LacI family DNA-binding transcriptional regulator [Subtercola vilae]